VHSTLIKFSEEYNVSVNCYEAKGGNALF